MARSWPTWILNVGSGQATSRMTVTVASERVVAKPKESDHTSSPGNLKMAQYQQNSCLIIDAEMVRASGLPISDWSPSRRTAKTSLLQHVPTTGQVGIEEFISAVVMVDG